MSLFLRLLTAFTITTVLIWRVAGVVAQPVHARAAANYLALAERQMTQADWEAARQSLNKAADYKGDALQVAQMRANLDRVSNDLFAERDYLISVGNSHRAELLVRLLDDYDSPKALLDEALQMFISGEERYAAVMLERARALDPTYSGLTQVEEYFQHG